MDSSFYTVGYTTKNYDWSLERTDDLPYTQTFSQDDTLFEPSLVSTTPVSLCPKTRAVVGDHTSPIFRTLGSPRSQRSRRYPTVLGEDPDTTLYCFYQLHSRDISQ